MRQTRTCGPLAPADPAPRAICRAMPGNPIMITIIYDGDCPFCKDYVRRLRLVEAAGEIELIDARANTPMVRTYWDLGHDLDEGMIVVIGERIYEGAAAVTALARLSSHSTLFNKLNHWALAHAPLTRLAYPLMKMGRRLALRLLGKKGLAKPINPITPPHR